jgi:hypothetical protein
MNDLTVTMTNKRSTTKYFALAVIIALCGCAHNQTREGELSDKPEEASAQIESWVPIGTSQTEAKRIMEQHHFTCYLTNADSLFFDYRLPNSNFTPTVYQMWMATLFLKDGKVSAVGVNTGLKG